MIAPPIPANERERLTALESYDVVDTMPEADYDDITRIASMICNTPIAMVSLIDDRRQFFKSRYGIDNSETPRELAFCAHAINTPDEMMIVPDSRMDHRFSDNPFVTGDPNVIFYAGMPLVTHDGFALGTLCVIDNIPREISEEQKKALKSLANQVIRLLELRKKNELLIRSQKQLTLFANEMEAFAYAASHDLKEPLRMVKSFLRLLEKKYLVTLDATAQKYIYFAVDGANRMEILINDLLEYSRAGRTGDEMALTDMNVIIDEVKQLYRLAIEEKGAIIYTGTLPVITVPHAAIRQVFQNLIGNALKYHAQGVHPIISIHATEIKTHWIFSVADNGIGISPEDAESVFTIFRRLHSKDEYAGTGIGLAVCKKIISQSGGEIWVESAEGKGSTFYCTIAKTIK